MENSFLLCNSTFIANHSEAYPADSLAELFPAATSTVVSPSNILVSRPSGGGHLSATKELRSVA